MKRIERLTQEEIQELIEVVKQGSDTISYEYVLEEMSSHLFGIALDYGFYDTEVREWIWGFVE